MNNAETNHHNHEDEISLKELILSLYKHRKLIMITTVLCVTLAVVYSFFIATPQYEARSESMINAPVEVDTRYGQYVFYSKLASDYTKYAMSDEVLERVRQKLKLDSSIQTIRSQISTANVLDSSRFELTTSGKSAKDAKALNDMLVEQFDVTLRIIMKRHALNTFIDKFEVQALSLQNDIDQKQTILAESKSLLSSLKPIYTLQKALFSDPKVAATYADRFDMDLSALSENVMIEEFANENYFNLEKQVTDIQLEIISLNQALRQTNADLLDLKKEKVDLDTKYQTENELQILNNKLDVYAGQFIVTSPAITPENPVGPKKGLNVVIGLILGLLAGCFVAFAKAYWGKA